MQGRGKGGWRVAVVHQRLIGDARPRRNLRQSFETPVAARLRALGRRVPGLHQLDTHVVAHGRHVGIGGQGRGEVAGGPGVVGVIVQLGGQTPLGLARALERAGVAIAGTAPDAIDAAEDRERFSALCHAAGVPQPSQAKQVDDAIPFNNLDLVMDIPLQVTVELGRSRRRINDVLKMGPGSVVELDQMEGEPVDILINQTLIAKGHVVVEKEKYGIRISEVVSRRERLKSIR